ncbi:hypothetical protein D3C85_1237780 [compost metagenome]
MSIPSTFSSTSGLASTGLTDEKKLLLLIVPISTFTAAASLRTVRLLLAAEAQL